MSDHFKLIGDVAAGTVTVLTIFNMLPAIAAAFAIVWYLIGFYEKISGKAFSQSLLARLIRWNWA